MNDWEKADMLLELAQVIVEELIGCNDDEYGLLQATRDHLVSARGHIVSARGDLECDLK